MAAEGFDRLPPQAAEAERSILGAMVLDRDAINQAIELLLREGDFYEERHRLIFAAMVGLHDRGSGVDLITLSEDLSRQGKLEAVGGQAFLAGLLDSVATTAHLEYHARIVQEKAMLRRLIHSSTDIVRRCYQESDDVRALLDGAEQEILSISQDRSSEGLLPLHEVVKRQLEIIQDLYEKKVRVTGTASGFVDLDNLTTGFQPSDLVIIAGRPSMGKTAFALNCALHCAIETHKPVAIFSLEMSKEQLVQRLLCSEARLNSHKVRTGHLRDSEWPQLATAAGLLAETHIYLDDSAAVSTLELRARARRLKQREPELGLVVVDYLQLMRGSGRHESRQQEISFISQSLKALAKEIKTPVMALSQLSRAVESRGGERRPLLSDLRESGAIEQDADLVCFIYRQEVYDREAAKGEAEILVSKQRNGPTGTVKLAFIQEYTRFENLARASEVGVG